MSKREFSKVSPAVWRSGRFTGLECSTAQVLYLYFLTCEHQNSAGCFRLPDGYACSDLGWDAAKYAAARDKLIAAELITVDPGTAEIYVDRWLKHNPPMNEKHALGTQRIIENIESDAIREKVEADFLEADEARSSKVVALHSSALANTRIMRGGRG
ncbi:hypothetical protein SAMN04488498_11399 [Mesorhizobium albiziae]|uniref:Uncharacterized protein n=1 Tax=Neomesorhizobium albiziae TaxID=335020 RepID=A0A1I4CIY9_9HYPH|nr:hypothetical protein [Mesorhizobium albiziae]GLS29296.1 hypothetical protein GCM10007937_10040 [Mesorhizobium albiziae]SFK81214.1 hypothetical protein SAMN04488498_11399 [Mesorhizobium albiziae]